MMNVFKNDDDEGLKKLLEQKGSDFTVYYGSTPLLVAVEYKKPRLVNIILRHTNCNVNAVNSSEWTSLYTACNTEYPSIEIIRKLLTYKANVNLSDDQKITPLMRASYYSHVPVMNLLIEAGADIDAQDEQGYTAMIYVLMSTDLNKDREALDILLFYNAKVSIPSCPQYNPLLYAIKRKSNMVDTLIPICKYEENFSEALKTAVSTNQFDIFEKLIKNGAKVAVHNTSYMLDSVICRGSAGCFDLLWRNINQKLYLNPETFTILFYKIFQQKTRLSFFKGSLKTIINTPDFNCNLTDERLVISTIFVPNRNENYDWNLCKDILLDFCEYINRQGIKLRKYDLIIFVQYFKGNCQFITELLAVFLKYDPNLVTMYDVMILNRFNDLNLASQLLYNCSDVQRMRFPQSFYETDSLNIYSEDMLKFFLQRFTPSKSETLNIRLFEKFDHINIESLKVPTLIEIARNALRTKTKLKEMIKYLHISSAIEDIIYFKKSVNHI